MVAIGGQGRERVAEGTEGEKPGLYDTLKVSG